MNTYCLLVLGCQNFSSQVETVSGIAFLIKNVEMTFIDSLETTLGNTTTFKSTFNTKRRTHFNTTSYA